MTLNELAEAAIQLATDLTADIPLSTTREQHIRVSARANAANQLAAELLHLSSPTLETEGQTDEQEQLPLF